MKQQWQKMYNVCLFIYKSGSIHIILNTYEPFGLGRFATDHSLTKVVSRPLFVHVRRYAPQRYFWNTVYTLSMHDYAGYSPDASQSDYLKFVYFYIYI